jgi:hypothetical protein
MDLTTHSCMYNVFALIFKNFMGVVVFMFSDDLRKIV